MKFSTLIVVAAVFTGGLASGSGAKAALMTGRNTGFMGLRGRTLINAAWADDAWKAFGDPGAWWSNSGTGFGPERNEINRAEFMAIEFTDRVLLLGALLTGLSNSRNDSANRKAALVGIFIDGVGLNGEYSFQSGNNFTVQDNNGVYSGAFKMPEKNADTDQVPL